MKARHRIANHAHRLSSRLRDVFFPAYGVDGVTADFFVSIGCNCRAATQLRRNRLRICSSPLDWMMRYRLRDAAELFKTGFSTFFSDIRELPNDSDETRTVEDVRNGMLSIHHFPKSLTLEEGRRAYRERAARHFANTHRFMSDAERLAMVTNSTESLDDIREFIGEMAGLYRADIVHINIRNGTGKKREAINLAGNAVLYDYTFEDVSFNEKRGVAGGWHQGNDYEWRRILRRCRRTRKFSPPEKMAGESYE